MRCSDNYSLGIADCYIPLGCYTHNVSAAVFSDKKCLMRDTPQSVDSRMGTVYSRDSNKESSSKIQEGLNSDKRYMTKVEDLLSFLLRCSTRPYESGHPMRLELTRVGLLVELANHYTTRSAQRKSKIASVEALWVYEQRWEQQYAIIWERRNFFNIKRIFPYCFQMSKP